MTEKVVFFGINTTRVIQWQEWQQLSLWMLGDE